MILTIIIFLISLLFTLFYACLFSWFIRGWKKQKVPAQPGESLTGAAPMFSIIIPARNEEKTIGACLNSIRDQDYPTRHFEVIVLDDHSEDATAELVEKFITSNSQLKVSLIKMAERSGDTTIAFKKQALAAGISAASYEWIITSDADCTRGNNWLSSIAAFIEPQMMLISAPVIYRHDHSFFQKAQALEFIGLIGIGAASIANHSPNLCNGANLIYRKSVYEELQGFKGIDRIASGDDELFMHKVAGKYPSGIHFLNEPAAAVYTDPSLNVKELLNQRRRWVSKSAHYDKRSVTYILISAYVFNLLIVFNLIAGLFEPKFLIVFIVMLAAKLTAEYIFLRNVSRFFGQGALMKVFLPAGLLHIPYTLIIGVYGNLGGYNWKGRQVR